MRSLARAFLTGAVTLLLAATCGSALARRSPHKHADRDASAATGSYDYYVMALSWSPTYCQAHPDEEEQCGHKGYGFVLHGLWPQYEGGNGPQRCTSDAEPDRRTVAQALAFMPSRRLVNHEWRTHGTCSGLDPAAYFQLADRAFASLQVPTELKAPRRDVQTTANDLRAALKRANPALRDDMLSLHCSQGELVEVRLCLDKDLALRRCGKRMRTGCPVSAPFTIPATN
ncbi:ribonuclease T2 family protein [Dokdonella sp.]|uniref:ribonuclease T2 family protein n=1 Tax=Dokdonella sp. TaxID=2291710 RepID=UPI003783B8AA